MNEKARRMVEYLERTTWSPVDYLLEKFNADRGDVSDAVEAMLVKMDVRVESDIIHVG